MAFQWLSLVGAIWLQSINGTNSNFPAYSSQLKRLLSISQLELNNLAFASDAGKILGWFAGVAAGYLPLWLVLMIGAVLGLIGYGMQYLFLTNQISSLSYVHVFLLTVLAGNSICWINTVCYLVAIKNFPLDRQFAVGISTSYVGLSAKIYTAFVNVLFPYSNAEKTKGYLLLNSILPLVVCIMAAPVVGDINVGKSKKMAGGFILMFAITIATGAYAVISSLGSVVSRVMTPLMVLIGIGLFLASPLLVPVADKLREKFQQKCWLRVERRVHNLTVEEGESAISLEDGMKVEETSITELVSEDKMKKEIGAKSMLKMVEFWLYFFVYFFGATLGLVYLNNLGQIAESRGCSDISSLVSLASSFGFFGRLIPSLLDYYFSRRKTKVSGPASMAVMMAPMAGSFFLLLNGTNLSLYISTAIIGVCTGAITSISVSTTTELFGTQNFGLNHNILVTNIPIGSFVFGYLAALFYRKEGHHHGDGRCMGMECYQKTFIIWGSLCLFGIFLALILHARTKNLFSQTRS
ncbi:unnamed protein product [Ilex paraguariensis]|uniref:Nodulin-like domain-containing protein n=1 Tax=Ilex paraguariensis TaxID=185542 RepID=A0ABC8T3Y7_9AQUA